MLPRNPAALFDTARVVTRLPQPLVDTFTDVQAAYDWLHRWPASAPKVLATEPPLTVATFLLLPPAQQVALAAQQGRTLAPRWEADFYVKRYSLHDSLLVEVYYHLHSEVLAQVQVRPL